MTANDITLEPAGTAAPAPPTGHKSPGEACPGCKGWFRCWCGTTAAMLGNQ